MDKKEVFVDISARHIHLTQEHVDILFGEKDYQLHVHRELAGGGGFSAQEQVQVIGPRNSFPKVRILGPCRKESQVELSKTDARTIGIDAPIRLSGDLAGTPGCKVVGPAGEIELDHGVIIAKRHIHMGDKTCADWGFKHGDVVAVKVETPDRTIIFGDTEIRMAAGPGEWAGKVEMALMHIDTDEANAGGMPGPMKGYIVSIDKE